MKKINNMEKKIFAIDFDGTLTTKNIYPYIGEPNWPVVNKVKEIVAAGHEVCLWTCRQGKTLDEAVDFCKNILGIEFNYVNTCSFSVIRDYQPIKMVADYYIDDRALELNNFINKEF